MWDDSRLFGFDMRHRTPPQIMPTAPSVYKRYSYDRMFKQYSFFYRWEVKLLARIFGIDTSQFSPYVETSTNAWRYWMKTEKFGYVEVDIFRENILLLPKDRFFQHIQLKLQKSGIAFSIIGDNNYIDIDKEENEVLFKSFKEQITKKTPQIWN